MTRAIDAPGLIELIRDETSRIADVVEQGGCDARVTHCGDWRVGDVVRHLGLIHRWAAEIVRTGMPAERLASAPDQDDSLAAWLQEGAEELRSALMEVSPDAACWTFGRSPGKAGFWTRRQALETSLHRFDVEHAIGLDPSIPTDLAVDGISDVVDFMFPRQVELGRADPLPGGVVLEATDVLQKWCLQEGQTRGARLAGPAAALLLSLWKRPHGGVSRTGDPAVLAALEVATITP